MAGRDEIEVFLPLPASVMHIVVALADGEKHGYAIMRDVADVSGGAVRMGSGTLYGSIKRMRLTEVGQRVGAAEQQRLAALVDAARERQLGLSPGGAW